VEMIPYERKKKEWASRNLILSVNLFLLKKKKTEEYSVFLSECDLLIGVQSL